jgi:hypothetical protein
MSAINSFRVFNLSPFASRALIVLLLLTPIFLWQVAEKNAAGPGFVLSSQDQQGQQDQKDSEGKEDKEVKEIKEKENKEVKEKEEKVEVSESEDEGEGTETIETVVNDDGTTSEIKRESSGKENKVEIKTFDAQGTLVGTRKVETKEGGQQEVKVKTYDAFGKALQEMKLKTKEGEVELKVKKSEGGESKVKYDAEDGVLKIKTADNESGKNEFTVRARGENFEIERAGVGVLTNFPMTVDEATGQVLVQTPAGEVALKALPDTIVEKAKMDSGLDEVEDVKLNADNGVKYVVSGAKSEKLLGVFNLRIPTQLAFDATTGDFVASEQSFVNRVLDLFSF